MIPKADRERARQAAEYADELYDRAYSPDALREHWARLGHWNPDEYWRAHAEALRAAHDAVEVAADAFEVAQQKRKAEAYRARAKGIRDTFASAPRRDPPGRAPPAPKAMRVAIHRFFGRRSKVDQTVEEVLEGKRSYSTLYPVAVSRLDTPRGGMYIVDGYHRVTEAILRGDPWLYAVVSRDIPRIERTGGAYKSWLDDMVNLRSYLDRLWATEDR